MGVGGCACVSVHICMGVYGCVCMCTCVVFLTSSFLLRFEDKFVRVVYSH